MGSSPLDLYAKEYFNSLNTIAEKISADITTTVAAYEDLWHTLSIKDQHQVINETIIHPEVVLKYSLCQIEDDCNLKESLVSQSYEHDESKGIGIAWSDEHSAPFSWKTRSQQDLSVFSDDFDAAILHANYRSSWKPVVGKKSYTVDHDSFIDHPNIVLGGLSSKLTSVSIKNASYTDNSNVLNKMKSKSVVLKIQSTKLTPSLCNRNSSQAVAEVTIPNNKVNTNCKTSKTLPSRLVSKPKIPPPPPPKFKQFQSGCSEVNTIKKCAIEEQSSHLAVKSVSIDSEALYDDMKDFNSLENSNNAITCDELPKTGFDFLDNW